MGEKKKKDPNDIFEELWQSYGELGHEPNVDKRVKLSQEAFAKAVDQVLKQHPQKAMEDAKQFCEVYDTLSGDDRENMAGAIYIQSYTMTSMYLWAWISMKNTQTYYESIIAKLKEQEKGVN